MMHLVSVIADGTETALPGDMAATGAFNGRLRAQSHWVFADGLAEPAIATVVDAGGEQPELAGYHAFHAARADLLHRLGSASSRARLTPKPFRSRPTRPSSPTCPAAVTSSLERKIS